MGDISVSRHKSNEKHVAFKDPLPNYKKGTLSKSGKNNVSHTNTSYDYVIDHISESDSYANVITIKNKLKCNVTTR